MGNRTEEERIRPTVAEYINEYELTTKTTDPEILSAPVISVEECSDHVRLFTSPGFYVVTTLLPLEE